MRDSIPLDIVRRVGEELLDSGAQGTLASLALASHGAYDAVHDVLYSRFEIAPNSLGVLDLSTEGETRERRLRCLRHVKHLAVSWIPSDSALNALHRRLNDGNSIFPRVTSLSLGPVALDQLRLWTPSSYATDLVCPLPLLLELLARHCSPSAFCAAFRLCPSDDWKRHQELATQGQYALCKRLDALAERWSLQTAAFHNVLFQVPPALDCANRYEFTPHVVDAGYRSLREVLAQQAMEARLLRERTQAARAAGNAGVVGVGSRSNSGAVTPRSDDTPGGYASPARRRSTDDERPSLDEIEGGKGKQKEKEKYKLLWGHQATLLPGPDWSIRPWQIALAVKGKFPSGSRERHTETLERTRWEAVNVEGGLYLQEREGADDSGEYRSGETELTGRHVVGRRQRGRMGRGRLRDQGRRGHGPCAVLGTARGRR